MTSSQFLQPGLAFVDIETTGGSTQSASITEVAVLQVDDGGVREWSSLIRPDSRIPEHIQRLTGITNEMVATAPSFEQIANELFDQLDGRIFVAHNARFDHGHLKAAFRRIGVTLRPRVLCTVKLSRRLFPQERRHSLDHLIARHGLKVDARHRALSDARVLWQFWQQLHERLPVSQLTEAIAALLGSPTLPPYLDATGLNTLSDTPGVYLFYGENDIPLYVGKSIRLRTRVMSHFSADHASEREFRLSQQVRRVAHIQTEGELGALLEEARLIKELQPTHNRQLRRNRDMCAWRLDNDLFGHPVLRLWRAADMDTPRHQGLYGFFRSRRDAIDQLHALCVEHSLCPPLLGLEKQMPGRCFHHQIKRCKGACLGIECEQSHAERLVAALDSLKVQAWPYVGPIGIKEGRSVHIVDNWCHYGSIKHHEDPGTLMSRSRPVFDLDIYKILLRMIPDHEVFPLAIAPPLSLEA